MRVLIWLLYVVERWGTLMRGCRVLSLVLFDSAETDYCELGRRAGAEGFRRILYLELRRRSGGLSPVGALTDRTFGRRRTWTSISGTTSPQTVCTEYVLFQKNRITLSSTDTSHARTIARQPRSTSNMIAHRVQPGRRSTRTKSCCFGERGARLRNTRGRWMFGGSIAPRGSR